MWPYFFFSICCTQIELQLICPIGCTKHVLQTLNLIFFCITDSLVSCRFINAKHFTSSKEVAKPTFSTRNRLQRALIGKHSNWIVWPLTAIFKETNSCFEESEPSYNCGLASSKCYAIILNLLDRQTNIHLHFLSSWRSQKYLYLPANGGLKPPVAGISKGIEPYF